MSKIEQLCRLIDGCHVMGDSAEMRLNAYHDARAVRSGSLKRDPIERYRVIQRAMKNYRVGVSLTPEMKTRILNYQTKAEIVL